MPSDMTPDQVRDEVAIMLGWKKHPDGLWRHDGDLGSFVRSGMLDHPCPASLDAVAALWAEHAEGWTWQCNDHYWFAFPPINPTGTPGVKVKRTGNEENDRYRLLLAVMQHKEKPDAK